ncbi:hypothetical protein HMPREF0262_02964 [Clostridium sp. ATCC 29733]|nr:hypothetical protein HMPREF0262_02964 [Clostridium sp. ATCC 29733]
MPGRWAHRFAGLPPPTAGRNEGGREGGERPFEAPLPACCGVFPQGPALAVGAARTAGPLPFGNGRWRPPFRHFSEGESCLDGE